MSSDRQRLIGAIRRIAREGAEEEGQAGANNRGSQPASVGLGVTESTDRLCCDGSVSSNPNPGTTTSDPGAGGSDGLSDTDPADLGDIGAGELTGVTDCETGEPVCFSGDCIPPDGWEDCRTPPVDPTYQEGYYWIAVTGVTPRPETASQTPRAAAQKWIDTQDNRTLGALLLSTESSYEYQILNATTGDPVGSIISSRNSCVSNPVPVCDDPPPLADAWQSDSCANLYISGGKIVGSKYDPENDGSYNAARDEIALCDGSGNQILIRGSASGGWKSIKGLSGDIDPDTSNGYLYSAYGDTIRQISPSEFRDDRV